MSRAKAKPGAARAKVAARFERELEAERRKADRADEQVRARDATIAELRRGLKLALDLSDEGWAYVPEYTRIRCAHDRQRELIRRIYAATGAGEKP